MYLQYKPVIVQDIKRRLTQIMEAAEWTADDQKWLLEYLDKKDTSELSQLMNENFTANLRTGEIINKETAKRILSLIHKRINPGGAKLVRVLWLKRVAAAVAILLISSAAYFFINNSTDKKNNQLTNLPSLPADITPGGNKAVLTLSDGSVVILDNAQNGVLSQQGSAKVLKLNDGQIAYNATGEAKEILYNTISTPRGGQYQMTLSDGSKLWMNAASSIRFPVLFSASERRIELTGEAYFEIAKDAARPFRINVADKQEVEVLGTHFNINAYNDEAAINTTLLEGKVKVSDASAKYVILAPGQQAQMTADGNMVIKQGADLEEITAWKGGFFHFESADLKTILRQFARWYDVEVVYQGEIKSRRFFAIINRNSTLSEVLNALQANDVKFKIEGKKLIVQKG